MHVAVVLAVLVGYQAEEPSKSTAKTGGAAVQPDPSWKSVGRSLWFDAKERRLYLKAKVVLRDGYLEHLMCSKGTKEHEAILATDAVPHDIHTWLIMTKAEPGKPVQFVPKFEPPTGSAIAIELRWMQDGKLRTADAREWVKGEKDKPLLRDWVFAGSLFYVDPLTKKERYAADDGDLITVANFSSAILDLPIESSANDTDRTFMTNTAKIPEVGTEVLVALYPRPAKPAAKAAAKTPAKPAERGPRTP
jgi:hypothetical protein